MNSNAWRSAKRAFTRTELLVIIAVVVISVVVYLVVVVLPANDETKSWSQAIHCVGNLKHVGLSFRQWSIDHNDKYPMAVSTNQQGTMEYVAGGNVFRHFQVISNELSTPIPLVCPNDNRIAVTTFTNLQNQNISYFIGLDASGATPAMLLVGDWNITNGIASRNTILELTSDRPSGWTEKLHNRRGNVGLGDNSVQEFSTLVLREALKTSGDSTNRIALPE